MALTCPRCGTDVPSEALYCPYCTLRKPKRGFTGAENNPQESLPQLPNPAVAASRAKEASPNSLKRATARPDKQPRRLRVSLLSVAALVAVFSVGVYIFVVPMVYSEQAEPKTILAAMDKLRKTPSDEPGVTIDAKLARQLETSRRVRNLVAYQGWTVRPVKGSKSKVVLVFSYEEVGGVLQSAEWTADLNTGTFTPQTDLAAAISYREPAAD